MGRSGKAKGSGKGAAKGGDQKESKYVKRVDLYKFLAKWSLRSYPDDRGRPLMLGAGKSTAQAALEPQTLRAMLDAAAANSSVVPPWDSTWWRPLSTALPSSARFCRSS